MRPEQGGLSTMRPRADSRVMFRGDSPLWLSFAVSGFSIVAARGFVGTGCATRPCAVGDATDAASGSRTAPTENLRGSLAFLDSGFRRNDEASWRDAYMRPLRRKKADRR